MQISGESSEYEGHFSDLVAMVRDTIRRRWLTLALITAAVFALGVALILMITPQYSSTVRIRIDPSRNPLSNQQAEAQATLNPEAIETEVTSIQSLELAKAVVQQLKLQRDPEFTKSLDDHVDGAALTAAERDTAVAQSVLRNLSVGREKLTYILSISYSSRDPAKAASIANAFAEGYLRTKVGNKMTTAESQADWFKQRLVTLEDEVRAADAAVAQYRSQAGLASGGGGNTGGTIVDQQVGPLSVQLAQAESEAAAAHATLTAAKQQIARGGIDAVSEVRNSTVIGDLRKQRADILRNMGEVQTRYGDKHPESLRVRDQLSMVDRQIRDEADRAISSLNATAIAAEARAASLRNAMGRLETQRASNTRAAVTAESLEREAAAKRAAYDKMSQMSLESTQAAQNQISPAVIVDKAEIPADPSWPNKPLLFALALIVAVAAGSGTIAVQEMLVSGLRTVEEAENQLGIPVLAAVPKVGKSKSPADILLERPTSIFAESLRIARASILGVRQDNPPKIIALTSALPGEGKTTTALAFARTLAGNGAKTLLLECDVRRAALRQVIKNPGNQPGIVEILHGEASLEEAITTGDVEGLEMMLVRSPYFSSEDLFGGGSMERILAELRGQYDHIVLDLPPLVGLADGRFLAVLADVTALIIRWDSTPAAAAAAALRWLKSDGANPIGAIYTMVDSSAEAIGGLYYSKKYSAYYNAA